MKNALILRCCLVKDFIGNHRFVHIAQHQDVSSVMKPDESFLCQINFRENLSEGMLLTLIDQFGVKRSGAFMCELLQNGFDAIKPHYANIMLDRNFSIEVPSALNDGNREIIEHLEMMHGSAETHFMCGETRCLGMNLIHSLSITKLFGISYAN